MNVIATVRRAVPAVTKTVIVEPGVEGVVTITMSLRDAEVLRSALNMMGGSPDYSGRRSTDRVIRALEQAGVAYAGGKPDCVSDAIAMFGSTTGLYFTNQESK